MGLGKTIGSFFSGGMDGLAGGVVGVVKKLVRDKDLAAKLESKLDMQELANELEKYLVDSKFEVTSRRALRDENIAQAKINLADAQSDDPYQRRWRPTFGYFGAISFMFAACGHSILSWITYWTVAGAALPVAPNETIIISVSVAMLGIRSYDHKGKREHVRLMNDR